MPRSVRIAMLAMVACMAAGCLTKPPAPSAVDAGAGGEPDAAVQVRHCAGTPFPSVPASTIGNFGGAVVGDPTMTDDQLELYFTYDPAPASSSFQYDIRRAVRSSTTGTFVSNPAEVLPFNMADVLDTDSSITADGLMIAFVSQRTEARVHVATRSSRTDAWSTASVMPGMENTGVDSVDLGNDGLDLYFSDGSGILHQASRTSRSEAFMISALAVYTSTDARFPTVSSDGLELFVNGNSETVVAQRDFTTDAFKDISMPIPQAVDSDVSPDGETLLAVLGGNIVAYRRVCP